MLVDLRDDALQGRPLAPGAAPPEQPLRRAAHLSHTGSATLLPVGSLTPLPATHYRSGPDGSGPDHGGWDQSGLDRGGPHGGDPDHGGPDRSSLDELRPRLLEPPPGSDEWPYLEPPAGGSGSLAVAPLAVHGTLLGLAVFRRERTDPFSEQDLRLAGELADRAALNIDRAHSFAGSGWSPPRSSGICCPGARRRCPRSPAPRSA
ncbi:GAF domain-containing protein [Streptacidiphilus sp. 4-A2]|nr:GAF domain-containing protein [Streptacidiphilus sp. 4-A2]